MFEIGFWELALIFGLALVVLGPDKLPKLASQLGRYAGQARRMARTLTTQLRAEMDAEEQRTLSRQAPPAQNPNPPAYSRPGMEELVPRGETASSSPAQDPETAHHPVQDEDSDRPAGRDGPAAP